ncbi:hypothetical protein D3C76_1294690 [compost metagenome]
MNIISEPILIMPPYTKNVAKPPNIHSESLFFLSRPFLKKMPARKPMMPKQNICQGVQGPCPKKKFETKPATAPTRNPASAPKLTPAMMTIATTGLNCGNIKKAARPATAMAANTAITMSSLACGFRFSNTIAKGIIV